jgi:endonuclease YncB( thermonuclease family)
VTLLPYTYWAPIDRVTDADTLHAAYIDQGLGHRNYGLRGTGWGIRFLGCNAWETETEAGADAFAALRVRLGVLSPAQPLWVKLHTTKPDSYVGRLDAQVELEDGTDLATWLIDNGWAAPWDGKSQPRPVPPWPRKTTT